MPDWLRRLMPARWRTTSLFARPVSRVWFWAPEWHWHGLGTLWPVHFGGDEAGRRTLAFGWTVTGRAIVAISRPGRLSAAPPEPEVRDAG
jgi:hypothetical protein